MWMAHLIMSLQITVQRSLSIAILAICLPIPKDCEVTITSSDEKVATVNAAGNVKAVGEGMAFITVSDSDESVLSGDTEPAYVHAFSCKSNQEPVAGEDDSQGRYNASIRGYALHDGYLYQFSGSSSIYVSVFDLDGNLQYCHRLDNPTEKDYYMPASISVVDGKVYVAIATGSSDYNLANVLVFE